MACNRGAAVCTTACVDECRLQILPVLVIRAGNGDLPTMHIAAGDRGTGSTWFHKM